MCTDRKKYASVLVTEDKQAIELWACEYSGIYLHNAWKSKCQAHQNKPPEGTTCISYLIYFSV